MGSPNLTCSGNSEPVPVMLEEECFRNYIYKVLKEVYDDTGISKPAMNIVNTFVNILFHSIALEAQKVTEASNRATLTARDIQNAVRNILPGELQKHAEAEGAKAVAKFKSYSCE